MPVASVRQRTDRTVISNYRAMLLSVAAFTVDQVCDMQNERLRKVQQFMLDLTQGSIRFA